MTRIRRKKPYFLSEKWQKAIKNSEKEVKKGQYKVYTTGKELEKDTEK